MARGKGGGGGVQRGWQVANGQGMAKRWQMGEGWQQNVLPLAASPHLAILATPDTKPPSHPVWHLYILTIKYNKAKIVFKYSEIFIEYKIRVSIYDY